MGVVTASEIERVARALGVYGFDASRLSLVHDEQGWSVQPAGGCCQSLSDQLTAAIILLGHARGLVVDVGECPACRERGDRWVKHDVSRTESSRAAMKRVAAGWVCDGTWDGRDHWREPCPACTLDGAPTGRHTLTWEAAVLAAMPMLGGKGVHESAKANGKTVSEWHRQVREALAVLADDCERRGDALGVLVTAWLRGECRACEGSGFEHGHTSVQDPILWRPGKRRKGATWERSCQTCNGHGLVLGAFEAQIADALAGIQPRPAMSSAS